MSLSLKKKKRHLGFFAEKIYSICRKKIRGWFRGEKLHGAQMEFIFVRKNTSRDGDFFQQKSASFLTYHALYITCIKSFFSNFSLLSRLAHGHAVSVGARLASVDPLSTSFLLPNQVISEVGRIFHPGDSYRCMHDMKATSSVLITSDASFDLSRASATPRNVAEAFRGITFRDMR